MEGEGRGGKNKVKIKWKKKKKMPGGGGSGGSRPAGPRLPAFRPRCCCCRRWPRTCGGDGRGRGFGEPRRGTVQRGGKSHKGGTGCRFPPALRERGNLQPLPPGCQTASSPRRFALQPPSARQHCMHPRCSVRTPPLHCTPALHCAHTPVALCALHCTVRTPPHCMHAPSLSIASAPLALCSPPPPQIAGTPLHATPPSNALCLHAPPPGLPGEHPPLLPHTPLVFPPPHAHVPHPVPPSVAGLGTHRLPLAMPFCTRAVHACTHLHMHA